MSNVRKFYGKLIHSLFTLTVIFLLFVGVVALGLFVYGLFQVGLTQEMGFALFAGILIYAAAWAIAYSIFYWLVWLVE